MGLFDFFRSTPSESKLQKLTDTIKNAKAIRDDRLAALDYFARQLDDPSKAIPSLLARFEYSLEHGINDTREKDLAMEGIIRFKEEAISIVLDYLKTTTKIAWPIKIIKSLSPNEDQIIECLLSALNYNEVSFDQAQTDKNYDILCHLIDYKRTGLAQKVSHFSNDPDERVRFAACEVLIEQSFDESSTYLEPLLSDSNPDNSRIKQTVVQKYLEHGWKIKNPAVFPNAQVIGPVFINQNLQLFVRQ